MSGVEKIIDDIISEAENSASAIISAAKIKSDAIISAAQADSEKKSAAALEQAKKDAILDHERAFSGAELEGRKILLRAKHEVLDEVFDRIALYYMQLDSDVYAHLLAKIADGDKNGGELIFSVRDKHISGAVMQLLDKNRFTLSEKTSDNVKSGFVLKNGDVETNCSMTAFVSGYRKALEPLVAKVLFEQN